MIEIRTFDGDPAKLAAFCNAVWKARYAGKMPIWLWTAPYIQWQLFSEAPGARDFLVAAYEGQKLVGVHPIWPVQYQLRGAPIRGTAGAFFSVDPAYENQGVSLKLVLEQTRRHREREVPLSTGFLILGARVAMGKDFWLRLRTTQIIAKLGFWTRMIDHFALSAFSLSRRDRWATTIAGWIQSNPTPPREAAGIRPYRPADLPDCLRLANDLSRAAEFGIVWTEASLGRQLAFDDVPRTIVAERDGCVAGFVNYYVQPSLGRREIRVAAIDLLAIHELPTSTSRDLVQTALAEMAAEGCHVARLLRTPGQPFGLLTRLGFIPEPPDHYYVAQSMTAAAPTVKTRSVHALLR